MSHYSVPEIAIYTRDSRFSIIKTIMQVTAKSIHKPFLQGIKVTRGRGKTSESQVQNGSKSQTLMCGRIITGMLTRAITRPLLQLIRCEVP